MASAESAIHFRRRADLSSGRHDIDFDDRYVWNGNQRTGMNRAFSACLRCDRMPGAVPQAKVDRAPLALRICLFCVAAAVAPAKSPRSA